MVRAKTWWMPGRPLAVGGPSKKTKGSPPCPRLERPAERSSAFQRVELLLLEPVGDRDVGPGGIGHQARRSTTASR